MAYASAGTLPLRIRLRGWWLNENLHAIFWLIMAIGVIAAYVCAHVEYKPHYEASISDHLDYAVRQYSVRPNFRTKRLELVVGHAAYDPSSDGSGPLGIGKLASVKGLLADTSTVLERYNTMLADAITHVLNAFQAKTAYPGYMVAGLADIAPKVYNRQPEVTTETPREQAFQIRIPLPVFRPLDDRARDETTAKLLIETIKGSVAERVVLSLPPGDTTDQDMEEALTIKPLERVALEAGNEVCERLRNLGLHLRPFFGGEDTPPAEQGASDDDCDFSSVYIAGTGGERGTRGNAAESTTDCTPGMGCYHETLKAVATEGVGFFWTAGNFRWIEVVALTILGVVVRRLIDFGIVFARLRTVGGGTGQVAQVWDPRESLRTFMYMVYAPVLAVAVIWLLTATRLVPADAILFGNWTSHALVPTAFLLGLFPDLGHLLLTRVARAVFGDVQGTEPPKRSVGKPPEAPQREAADDAGDGPPSLESLRLRIRFIYTSLFR